MYGSEHIFQKALNFSLNWHKILTYGIKYSLLKYKGHWNVLN